VSADNCPVVIGGVGGSGTRVVAAIVAGLGFHLGRDVNEALDNLWFTLLFKRLAILNASDSDWAAGVDLFGRAMLGGGRRDSDLQLLEQLTAEDRPGHSVEWLRDRGLSLQAALECGPLDGAWGFKEPNTHVFLHRLSDSLPTMRYIHVIRHGFDMAFSQNMNQARFWGPVFLGEPFEATPRYLLRYWCVMNRRVCEVGATMPGRFLVVRYDDLCSEPHRVVAEICRFSGCQDAYASGAFPIHIKPAASIGRWRGHATTDFAQDDVDYVAACGFSISPA